LFQRSIQTTPFALKSVYFDAQWN